MTSAQLKAVSPRKQKKIDQVMMDADDDDDLADEPTAKEVIDDVETATVESSDAKEDSTKKRKPVKRAKIAAKKAADVTSTSVVEEVIDVDAANNPPAGTSDITNAEDEDATKADASEAVKSAIMPADTSETNNLRMVSISDVESVASVETDDASKPKSSTKKRGRPPKAKATPKAKKALLKSKEEQVCYCGAPEAK